ncbi:hypothetical protein GK461_21745 [Salmonella enterica]|nr:hypothetical protein [Salmonella enterica]EEI0516396.1 hypothetical protein [Salmonella enterica]EEL6759741.1 hypothetical protein [Salmonella enterica]
MDNILNTIKNTFLLNSTQFLFIASILIVAFLCDLWLIRKEKAKKQKIEHLDYTITETEYTETEYPTFDDDYFDDYSKFTKSFSQNTNYNIRQYLDEYCLKVMFRTIKDHSMELIYLDHKINNIDDGFKLQLLSWINLDMIKNLELEENKKPENLLKYINAKRKFFKYFSTVIKDMSEIHSFSFICEDKDFLEELKQYFIPMCIINIHNDKFHEVIEKLEAMGNILNYTPEFISESIKQGFNEYEFNKSNPEMFFANKSIEETEDIIYKGAEDIITDVFEKLKKNKI